MIEIGGIITTVHVLVVEHSDFYLILGRPFERKSRMRTTNNDDGSLTTEIFSGDGKMTLTFQSAMALHPQNRTMRFSVYKNKRASGQEDFCGIERRVHTWGSKILGGGAVGLGVRHV